MLDGGAFEKSFKIQVVLAPAPIPCTASPSIHHVAASHYMNKKIKKRTVGRLILESLGHGRSSTAIRLVFVGLPRRDLDDELQERGRREAKRVETEGVLGACRSFAVILGSRVWC
jgi:hypothetical protein